MVPDGMRAWISLIDKHGGIDPTIEVASPTGGKHVYFRYDPKFPVTNSEGARGDGGYVILPPSLRSDGKAYVAKKANPSGSDVTRLQQILENVVGIDIHPLAVIIARATYLLTIRSLVTVSKRPIQIPVYLTDSLFLPAEILGALLDAMN
jgi:Bifunctional DNA primase/polymerase, N-terminal